MKKRIMALIVAAIMLLTAVPSLADVDKKEMVYVLANADGSVDDIIVSERLYNRNGEAQLHDESSLTDIENVGGDETFTNENGVLVWNANGADIRYEGNSDRPLPVSVTLRYYLDGQEMTADQIAGKSGHLAIDVEYRAEQYEDVAVGDETVSMPMPFLAATVLLTDEANFKNITVDNGRVLDIGDRSVIVAMGLPGVSEALNLAAYEELDVEIPTTARIEADVTDFALDGTYTLATNSIFNDIDTDEGELDIDLDQMQDDLSDAMEQLLDGATQLRDGAQELSDGATELSDGLNEIDSNSDKLVDAAKQLLQTVRQERGCAAERDGRFRRNRGDRSRLRHSARSAFPHLRSGRERWQHRLWAFHRARRRAGAGRQRKRGIRFKRQPVYRSSARPVNIYRLSA